MVSEEFCRYLIPELDPKTWHQEATPKYAGVCHNQQCEHFGEMMSKSWPKEGHMSPDCDRCPKREPR